MLEGRDNRDEPKPPSGQNGRSDHSHAAGDPHRSPLLIPQAVREIFDKPGGDWTQSDRDCIVHWIYATPRIVGTFRTIGWYCLQDWDEAEHELIEFCSTLISRGVPRYRPAEGRSQCPALSYLKNRWRNHLRNARRRIERWRNRERQGLPQGGGQEWEPPSSSPSPLSDLQRREAIEATRRACQDLPARERFVINARFGLDSKGSTATRQEIAEGLGVAPGKVTAAERKAVRLLRISLRRHGK